MLLSIIVHGRNDGYMGNFLWRLQTVLNRLATNIEAIPEKGWAEIVLCDWGSTAELKLIDSLKLNKDCLKLLKYIYVKPAVTKAAERDSNYSSSHAVNTAVRRAAGKHLLICDSDVYCHEQTINTIYQCVKIGQLAIFNLNDTFFWAARYHVPKQFVATNPSTAELDAYILAHADQLVCDTPRDHFGGAVCAHFLTKEMWTECTGLDEKLIYWGVNDIDIHNRLCMKYNCGGIIDDAGMRFYHLEHYNSRGSNNQEFPRKVNTYSGATSIKANNEQTWGLNGMDLTYDINQKPSRLQALYRQIIESPAPDYDERLGVAMNFEQYLAYQKNHGHTYYLFLNKLVRIMQPQRILELGTSIGRSALFMMVVLPMHSRLTTIDIGSYQRVDLAGFSQDDRLKIIFGSDLEQKIIDQVPRNIDLLYIDSEHTYDQVMAEWKIYQHHLVDNAIVVMDDIHVNEGMDQFWNGLTYEKIDLGKEVHFSGFGMFQFKR